MKKIEIVEEEIVPVCPHCKKELTKITQVKRGAMSVIGVFCCPHCRAVLGVSLR
ncbi:MAG TPA: hypothetical protein PKM43_24155 [Verrucomicrobiota bacterium]|nr:hypothetical protein [Verrucomicrobiota bacterium]